MNYFKNLWKAFRQSIKFRLWFFYIIGVDIAFYLMLIISGILFLNLLQPQVAVIQRSAGLALNELDESLLMQHYIELKSAAVAVVMLLSAWVFFMLLLYTVSKGVIWNIILKKSFKPIVFLKFLGLNFVFFAFQIILIIGSFILFKEEFKIFFIIFLLLPSAIYLVNIIHPLFFIREKLWRSFLDGIGIAAKSVHRFILPFTFLGVIFFTIIVLLQWLGETKWFNSDLSRLYTIVVIIFVVVFFNWSKLFIKELLINELKR